MKELIKKILKEAVGVPKDIELAAENLFVDVVNGLIDVGFSDGPDEFKVKLSNYDDRYSFSNFSPEDISFSFELGEFPINNPEGVKDPIVAGMKLINSSFANEKFKIVILDSKNIEISLTFAVPENFEREIRNSDISEFLVKNKANMVSSMAHELKHAYDGYVKPSSEKVSQRVKYTTQNSYRIGLTPIDKLLYSLYFTNVIENSVRPTEVFTNLKSLDTNQRNFLTNFNSLKTIKELKAMSTFTYEDLINGLKENMVLVDELLSKVSGYSKPTNTNEEKITAALEISHKLILNQMKKNFDDIANSIIFSPNKILSSLMRFFEGSNEDSEIEKIQKKMLKDLFKYSDNPEIWFKYQINKMNKEANKLYRGLTKLYSLMPSKTTYLKKINTEIYDPTSFETSQLRSKIKKYKR